MQVKTDVFSLPSFSGARNKNETKKLFDVKTYYQFLSFILYWSCERIQYSRHCVLWSWSILGCQLKKLKKKNTYEISSISFKVLQSKRGLVDKVRSAQLAYDLLKQIWC